jgi:hypothetical protein
MLESVLNRAKLHAFDIVLVGRMDWFGRSLQSLIANLQVLDSVGIRFVAAIILIEQLQPKLYGAGRHGRGPGGKGRVVHDVVELVELRVIPSVEHFSAKL